jgi:hypothetical protein
MMPKRVKITNCTVPAGAIYIGRRQWCGKKQFKGTPWGNYFYPSLYDGCIEGSLRRYREKMEQRPDLIARLPTDKDLACFCDLDSPCYGDVLLELLHTPSKEGLRKGGLYQQVVRRYHSTRGLGDLRRLQAR